MADKLTQTSRVKFEWLFTDGDTRTLTLQDALNFDSMEEDELQTQIEELETYIMNAEDEQTLLIGDKSGADFRRINVIVAETIAAATLDLTDNGNSEN